MFCQNCGKEISEDTKFCPACGTAVNQAGTIVEVKEQKEVAENLVNDLQKCNSYFSQISNVYRLQNIGINLVNNATWCKKVKDSYVSSIVFLILGIGGALFTIPPILNEPLLLLGLWEVLVFELVFFIAGLVQFSIYGKHRKTLEYYKANMPLWNDSISKHYQNYKDCPLPIEFSDPVAISSIISYLKSKRADSLKEAINLYEDECHKAQVIIELQEMKAAAKQAATAASITALNTAFK